MKKICIFGAISLMLLAIFLSGCTANTAGEASARPVALVKANSCNADSVCEAKGLDLTAGYTYGDYAMTSSIKLAPGYDGSIGYSGMMPTLMLSYTSTENDHKESAFLQPTSIELYEYDTSYTPVKYKTAALYAHALKMQSPDGTVWFCAPNDSGQWTCRKAS